MTVMTVNVHEAKTQLSKLLLRISMGEEVVIAKAGMPVARLVPFAAKPMRRVAGSAQGQVWMAPDYNVHEAETQRSPLMSSWEHLKHEVSFGEDMGGG